MTARTLMGTPLTPGVNVDPIDITAGFQFAKSLGYVECFEDEMVVTYALQRHARGEEDGAERTWMEHFGKPSFTQWRMVLAAAVAEGTRQLATKETHDTAD